MKKQLLAAVSMALPEDGCPKARSVFLKGRFFEHISYEELLRRPISDHHFLNKEIRFEEVTLIQSFNHIRRNTVLFKFTQPHTFLVVSATIEKISEMLPSFFEQVHQSFIVNTRFITAQRKGHYVTIAEENIPVSAMFVKMSTL